MENVLILLAVIGGCLTIIGISFDEDNIVIFGCGLLFTIFGIALLLPPSLESKASSKEPIINVDSIYKAGYYKGLMEADSVLKKCECSDGTVFLLKK